MKKKRGQAASANPAPALQYVSVHMSDIAPHETPDSSVVSSMVRFLQAGGQLEPIEIDWRWERHWTQGPREMECIGTCYGLIDSHHRFAALQIFYGADRVITARSKEALAVKSLHSDGLAVESEADARVNSDRPVC